MLNKEHEQNLENIFARLSDEELESIYALVSHIDEEITLRADRYRADGELEQSKEDRQISLLTMGFSYGEAAGCAIARDMAIEELGRIMTLSISRSNSEHL